MIQLRAMAFLAVLVVLGTAAWADEAQPGDAAKFLKEKGLEDYHAMCVKFVTALVERRLEAAHEIVIRSNWEPYRHVDPAVYERVCDFLARIGVEELELVGYSEISSSSLSLHYVLNTDWGPVLIIMVAYRYQNVWHTNSFHYDSDSLKLMDRLKGITRFSKSIVVPLKRQGKTA
jgi:hypothetical protein